MRRSCHPCEHEPTGEVFTSPYLSLSECGKNRLKVIQRRRPIEAMLCCFTMIVGVGLIASLVSVGMMNIEQFGIAVMLVVLIVLVFVAFLGIVYYGVEKVTVLDAKDNVVLVKWLRGYQRVPVSSRDLKVTVHERRLARGAIANTLVLVSPTGFTRILGTVAAKNPNASIKVVELSSSVKSRIEQQLSCMVG